MCSAPSGVIQSSLDWMVDTNFSDIDTKLHALEKQGNMLIRWGRRIVLGENVKLQFYNCLFIKLSIPIVLWNVKIAAQLDDPTAKLYTNASELIYTNLQLTVDRMQLSLPALVD